MKLLIVHQHDPTIPNVGGIGTFIDAFIRNAPTELDIDLVGVSVNTEQYPLGQWHEFVISQRRFRFLPVLEANPVHVPLFPLTIRLLWSLYRHKHMLDLDNTVIEFHRVEYLLGFITNKNAKVLFLHGHNMKDFYNNKTEVRWGKFPWLYFALEKRLLPQADYVHIVREDAVKDYQEFYPAKADVISFLPTWVDESVFQCLAENERTVLRERLCQTINVDPGSTLYLFVGRFEGQKDPLRLLAAFKQVKATNPTAVLLLIGDGSLKAKMQAFIAEHGLAEAVHFLRPMPQTEMSKWMNSADALCLTSAFEGMPCVILEALYCGLPVVSTAVGEAWRLIGNSEGGRLVEGTSAEAFAQGMLDIIAAPPGRQSCRNQVTPYTAAKILVPTYQLHSQLGK